MSQDVPFSLRRISGNLIMAGDLDGSQAVWQKAAEVLAEVRRQKVKELTIVSADVRLGYDAAKTWVKLVQEYLGSVSLRYQDSQLAENLVCLVGYEYKHAGSRFELTPFTASILDSDTLHHHSAETAPVTRTARPASSGW